MLALDEVSLLLETPPADRATADTAVTPAAPVPALEKDASGWPQVLVRPDLLHHASLSFTLAAGFTVLFRDHVAAGGLALGLGVVKELWDSRHRGADALDLVADVLGVAAALVIVPE
jgi:hypothetical protein